MFVSPTPTSYVETLTPNVMILKGGTFERELGLEEGHEGGALTNGLSALLRVTRELASSLCSFPWEDTRNRKFGTWKKVFTILDHASTPILDLTTYRKE